MHLFHQVLVCFFDVFLIRTWSCSNHNKVILFSMDCLQILLLSVTFFPTVGHWFSTIQWHVTGTQSQLYQPQPNIACCTASKHTSDNTLWQVCLVPYWHRVGKLWNSSGQLTEKSSAIACLNPPIACNKSLGCMCQLNHLLERYDTLNVSVMNSWSQKPLKQKR